MTNGRGWQLEFTPAARRTIALCRHRAADEPDGAVWIGHLLRALISDESLASACLLQLGVTRELLAEVWPLASQAWDGPPADCPLQAQDGLKDPPAFTSVLDRAAEIQRRFGASENLSSSHLLLAVIETDEPTRGFLDRQGIDASAVGRLLFPDSGDSAVPLAPDEPIVFRDDSSSFSVMPSIAFGSHLPSVWRVLDAGLNRTREGLRVLEDAARFVFDDAECSLVIKCLRHDLVTAERDLCPPGMTRPSGLLSSRDTEGDVGTELTTDGERCRRSMTDLVTANCRRVQESLRSLEEFGKFISPEFSTAMKSLRYQVYTLEKRLWKNSPVSASDSSRFYDEHQPPQESFESRQLQLRRLRLRQSQVYVLITESLCRQPWQVVVEQSLQAGVDVIQIREKSLNDRELIRRAIWIRDACRAHQALMIVNDRADLAVAADADGVHVGQDELTITEARSILKPWQVVGVSTHSVDQFLQADAQGADYLGVGPVFPSTTKSFTEFPGLSFVESIACLPAVPWFAIGGISLQRLNDVIRAGATRVALTSAVTQSEHPGEVVRELRTQLNLATAGTVMDQTTHDTRML